MLMQIKKGAPFIASFLEEKQGHGIAVIHFRGFEFH